MELVPIYFRKIMQSRAYTVIFLGDDTKQFAIYTDPLVGKNLQLLLTKKQPQRPYTHDLIHSIFEGLEVNLLQVVINNVEDTIYFSRLFLEQMIDDKSRCILEIDARPSDALILALMHEAPIFCRKEVMEKAIPIDA